MLEVCASDTRAGMLSRRVQRDATELVLRRTSYGLSSYGLSSYRAMPLN